MEEFMNTIKNVFNEHNLEICKGYSKLFSYSRASRLFFFFIKNKIIFTVTILRITNII